MVELTVPEGLLLTVSNGRLGLAFADEKPLRPYCVDFLSSEWMFRHRRGLRENKSFFQALGLKPGTRVLDATAGFGQDAFLMAWGGAEVTAVEKSPVVHQLLKNGLERAFIEGSPWGAPFKLFPVLGDSIEMLKRPDLQFDTVYLDPMFEKPKRSAKSPKPMQLLQALLKGEEPHALEILEAALQAGLSRVVLKLPLKAASTGQPSFSIKGQSIRYDVYVR